MRNPSWLWQTEKVSWRHYISAFVLSLIAPLLVASFQSIVVKMRDFLPEKAMLYEAMGSISDFGTWLLENILWIGTVTITVFLILCPFLKFRILRWIVFGCLLVIWTYLFCR